MGRRVMLRKLTFLALMVLLVGAFAEFVSFVGLSFLEGRVTGLGVLNSEKRTLVGSQLQPAATNDTSEDVAPWILGMRQDQVLHPYLGFVDRPRKDLNSWGPRYQPDGNNYGFPKNFHAFFSGVGSDDVVVVVVGGSVAHQIAAQGRPEPYLEKALSTLRKYRGNQIKLLNLAVGGFKQPQQLVLVNYFMALGMPLDVLINIDGFNEVTLPVKDNISVNVNPFYPRSWKFRVEAIDSEERRIRGEISFLDSLRKDIASWFLRPPIRYSFTAGLAWRLIDGKVRIWGVEREMNLLDRPADQRTLETSGPAYEVVSTESLYDDLTDVWYRCSVQMHSLAAAQGIDYFHFLQPNQYDQGSKKLNAAERRTAWDPQSSFVESVAIGYPKLRHRGEELRAVGVRFVDLSAIFRDIDRTLYIDPCCHLNHDGVKLFAEAIAEAIEQADGSE